MATSPSDGVPGPSPQELAAIVAAVEVAWPVPAPAEPADRRPPARWRFSGRRWWGRRLPTLRRRPW